MKCIPENELHTEECIKGISRCDGTVSPEYVICELCGRPSVPGTSCIGEIEHDVVD